MTELISLFDLAIAGDLLLKEAGWSI